MPESNAALEKQNGNNPGQQHSQLEVSVCAVSVLRRESQRVGHQERGGDKKHERDVYEDIRSCPEKARGWHVHPVCENRYKCSMSDRVFRSAISPRPFSIVVWTGVRSS